MRRMPLGLASTGLAMAVLIPLARVRAQESLAPIRLAGQSVTPVFEGWYRNADGTYSLSFGYFNRNAKEVVQIPVGPDNAITPGAANQGQPAQFEARRHWGVFAVIVPSSFGKNKVTWTLKNRGETFAIAGSLDPLWEIDALQGDATDNRPPVLKFSESGPELRGPAGGPAAALLAAAGVPVEVAVWARDEAGAAPAGAPAGREVPVTLTWFKHQGPGDVTFASPSARVPVAGGRATVMTTFSKPGDYILRIRANDGSVAAAGHSQCCWTNGFIKVQVTP